MALFKGVLEGLQEIRTAVTKLLPSVWMAATVYARRSRISQMAAATTNQSILNPTHWIVVCACSAAAWVYVVVRLLEEDIGGSPSEWIDVVRSALDAIPNWAWLAVAGFGVFLAALSAQFARWMLRRPLTLPDAVVTMVVKYHAGLSYLLAALWLTLLIALPVVTEYDGERTTVTTPLTVHLSTAVAVLGLCTIALLTYRLKQADAAHRQLHLFESNSSPLREFARTMAVAAALSMPFLVGVASSAGAVVAFKIANQPKLGFAFNYDTTTPPVTLTRCWPAGGRQLSCEVRAWSHGKVLDYALASYASGTIRQYYEERGEAVDEIDVVHAKVDGHLSWADASEKAERRVTHKMHHDSKSAAVGTLVLSVAEGCSFVDDPSVHEKATEHAGLNVSFVWLALKDGEKQERPIDPRPP